MADTTGYNGALTANGTPIPQKYHDNGDGTWSLEGAAAGGEGDASAANQEALNALIGEVQATPTANTLLRRLKDLLTGIVLAAGSNFIGTVGGTTVPIEPTIAVSTTPAYSIGDCVGGKITLSSALRAAGKGAILQSLFLRDTSNQRAGLELLIFNADPSASTLTDNAAVAIHANDVGKVIRRISIAASDYITIDSKAWADLSPGGRALHAASGVDLYAALVTTGTPTYALTTAIGLRLGVMQD